MSTINTILDQCLTRLGKRELLSTYSDYLVSEWYNSTEDLKAALDDEKAWQNMKLPARLKIELKKELEKTGTGGIGERKDKVDAAIKHDKVADDSMDDVVGRMIPDEAKNTPGEQYQSQYQEPDQSQDHEQHQTFEIWSQIYSEEYDCYYYYNNLTQVAQWELPADFPIIEEGSIGVNNVDIHIENNEHAEGNEGISDDDLSCPSAPDLPSSLLSPLRRQQERAERQQRPTLGTRSSEFDLNSAMDDAVLNNKSKHAVRLPTASDPFVKPRGSLSPADRYSLLLMPSNNASGSETNRPELNNLPPVPSHSVSIIAGYPTIPDIGGVSSIQATPTQPLLAPFSPKLSLPSTASTPTVDSPQPQSPQIYPFNGSQLVGTIGSSINPNISGAPNVANVESQYSKPAGQEAATVSIPVLPGTTQPEPVSRPPMPPPIVAASVPPAGPVPSEGNSIMPPTQISTPKSTSSKSGGSKSTSAKISSAFKALNIFKHGFKLSSQKSKEEKIDTKTKQDILPSKDSSSSDEESDEDREDNSDDDEPETVEPNKVLVTRLREMGFTKMAAKLALQETRNDLSSAAYLLLQLQQEGEPVTEVTAEAVTMGADTQASPTSFFSKILKDSAKLLPAGARGASRNSDSYRVSNSDSGRDHQGNDISIPSEVQLTVDPRLHETAPPATVQELAHYSSQASPARIVNPVSEKFGSQVFLSSANSPFPPVGLERSIIPNPGFAMKVQSGRSGIVYINICHHPEAPCLTIFQGSVHSNNQWPKLIAMPGRLDAACGNGEHIIYDVLVNSSVLDTCSADSSNTSRGLLCSRIIKYIRKNYDDSMELAYKLPSRKQYYGSFVSIPLTAPTMPATSTPGSPNRKSKGLMSLNLFGSGSARSRESNFETAGLGYDSRINSEDSRISSAGLYPMPFTPLSQQPQYEGSTSRPTSQRRRSSSSPQTTNNLMPLDHGIPVPTASLVAVGIGSTPPSIQSSSLNPAARAYPYQDPTYSSRK